MYIGKERRVSTMADRRIKTPMARWFGRRAGFDKNYRQGMLYVADRRATPTEMHIYQDKQSKERRIRIADRRVKTPMARRLGGTRAGLDNNYRDDMPYVVIGADRRAKTTETIDDMIACYATEPPNPSDTAELLKKYREALITAYELGKNIRETYGIVPPKVIYNNVLASSVYLKEGYQGVAVTISLTVK